MVEFWRDSNRPVVTSAFLAYAPHSIQCKRMLDHDVTLGAGNAVKRRAG